MLIRNLRLVDGAGDIRDGVDVRIHEGRFAEIGPGLDGAGEELDAGGATAIPGLIDAHTHLTLDATPDALDNAIDLPLVDQAGATARRAAALLGHGVTTAREVGGRGGAQPRTARLDRLGLDAGAAYLHGRGVDDRAGRPRLARRAARHGS